jgi:DNA repair protein RecN (Recombination protein N)
MLLELHVKNLAVIEELRLGLREGLTVLSGDEGAGKSLLVDALCLLAGGRASSNLIRSGASAALVEGVFCVEPDDGDLVAMLEEAGMEVEPDGILILTREVQEQGKSIARVNGRAIPVSLLREMGRRLMDIHSQMEHLSLLSPQHQMDLLDSYGGLLALRRELEAKVSRLREKAREISLIAGEKSQRERELLEYQVAEIDRANIQQGEDEALEQEWQVLQRAQELKEYCYAAYSMLYADDRSATAVAHQAIKALQRAMSIDSSLQPQVEELESAVIQLEEIARGLSRYTEAIEDSPERLQQVEERLELLRRLKHKYGLTLENVIRFANEARSELQALESQEERRCQLRAEYRQLKIEAGKLAERLSRARQEAAGRLSKLVNLELADLGMPWARFDVDLTREECPDGLPAYQGAYSFTQHGIDRIQFLASTNPGEPLRPLAEIASGGETCRFMLALKSALRQADSIPTLVFDEIDAGIGGRNAHVVGKKLATLAESRQVICITHLPQIACFGSDHYRVVKDVSGPQAVVRLEHLSGDTRVQELAAMLGSGSERPMLESAQVLLRCASEIGKARLISVSDERNR